MKSLRKGLKGFSQPPALMAVGNTSSNHTAPLNTAELYNDNPAPAIKLGKAVFILLLQD